MVFDSKLVEAEEFMILLFTLDLNPNYSKNMDVNTVNSFLTASLKFS